MLENNSFTSGYKTSTSQINIVLEGPVKAFLSIVLYKNYILLPINEKDKVKVDL